MPPIRGMESPWHVFDPEVMYWAPKQVQSIWGAESIFITENGCAASDVVAEDGRVYDSDRVMFMRTCLGQLQRASFDGVPVDGYFYWSSQDNFEWIYGYDNRFGLIYVDFETQQWIPKLSAEWVPGSGAAERCCVSRWSNVIPAPLFTSAG